MKETSVKIAAIVGISLLYPNVLYATKLELYVIITWPLIQSYRYLFHQMNEMKLAQ